MKEDEEDLQEALCGEGCRMDEVLDRVLGSWRHRGFPGVAGFQ